jgi:hypothetical protein
MELTLTPEELIDLLNNGARAGVLTVSSDYAMDAKDAATVLVLPGATNVSLTLPDARLVSGRRYTVKLKRSGATYCVLHAFSAQTLDTFTLPLNITNDGAVLELLADGGNWLVLSTEIPNASDV